MTAHEPAAVPSALSQDADPLALSAFCPVYQRAIELVGQRWNGAIVRALLSGAVRFGEIEAAIPGLGSRMLSDRLKHLEATGIVRREVFPETPVRVEYRLTVKGRDLADVIEAVSAWASRWAAAEGIAEHG